VLERLEQTAALAREQAWPYERFLETLLEAEVFARDASGARMRVRAAGFPAIKTLEDFDWTAQPSAERPLVLHLAQLAWIEERGNVCFLGPPGTGKTHCAIALGLKACEHATASPSPPPRNGSVASKPHRTATSSSKSCADSSDTTS
jgi:DNA replication protein DnaC